MAASAAGLVGVATVGCGFWARELRTRRAPVPEQIAKVRIAQPMTASFLIIMVMSTPSARDRDDDENKPAAAGSPAAMRTAERASDVGTLTVRAAACLGAPTTRDFLIAPRRRVHPKFAGESRIPRHRRKRTPELTLDRTVRLLEAALGEPELRLPRATALVDYHLRRNEVARKSHAKTWRAKHRAVKFLRL